MVTLAGPAEQESGADWRAVSGSPPTVDQRLFTADFFVNDPHILTEGSLCFERCVGIGCDLVP